MIDAYTAGARNEGYACTDEVIGVVLGVFKDYLVSKEILAPRNTRLLAFVCLPYLALEPGGLRFPEEYMSSIRASHFLPSIHDSIALLSLI